MVIKMKTVYPLGNMNVFNKHHEDYEIQLFTKIVVCAKF